MSKIHINGKCIEVEGSLLMTKGKWYDGTGREIDLNNIPEAMEAKTISITIEGNIDRLTIDDCSTVVVNGNCKKVKTKSGDVRCHDVEGDVDTVSGDIECEVVHGDASTMSGNICSREIHGRSKTNTGKINGKCNK